MFDDLGLHRIMAGYLPHNKRSGKLLDRLGFEKEGLARKYLKINGRWEDHLLTSLINDT
jgi:ribosomal-protein-alanine N-acetyltransferase